MRSLKQPRAIEPMYHSNTSVASRIQRWASRQLADYDAHHPGTLFAEGVVLNVTEGYELQAAVAELRRLRGEQIIGDKVGCTSSKIRAQLGIDHCVTGRLFDSEQHLSGAELSRQSFVNLAIEGELAVELLREPTAQDFVGTEIPPCVARVFPVIELHNHVMRGEQPSAGELIANNAIHAGFVAGSGVISQDASGEPSLAIFVNDRLLDECAGPVLIQTIHSSLKWLMEIVHDRGERLSAGQIVLTGSIPSLIPIGEDCRISVDAGPLGRVEVTFVT
jgi:2-keto-4-pentenoate hydratase